MANKQDPRGRIVELLVTPALTTSNAIGRYVVFEDGSGEIQSYLPEVGWITGGTDFKALMTAGAATEEILREMGYTAEEIEEIYEFVTDEDRQGWTDDDD